MKKIKKRQTRRWTRISSTCSGLSLSGLLASCCAFPHFNAGTKPCGDPPVVAQDRLEAHVTTLSVDYVPRDWNHPRNLDRAAAYIHAGFSSAGGKVAYQTYEMDGKTYRNVIARFGPPGGERIVVGAHYDAAGEFPGADDNASAVAGLLELASLLGATPPPICVELVAYTLEEPKNPADPDDPGLFRSPFGGSAVHAISLVEEGVAVRVALVMDMIGYFSDENGSQDLPSVLLKPFFPSRGNFIAVIGKFGQGNVVREVKDAMSSATPLPVCSLSGPAFIEGVDWSDHSNYWKAGHPAVLITDTSFYRNKQYHKAGDTADRLDYERMAMVVQGVHAAVLAFAEDR